MKIRYLAAAAILSVSAHAAAADNGESLFKQHNCAACHAATGKSVGPSVADISAKYKDSKDAQAKLEAKVRKGGAGSFGNMPMPPTAKSVSDADVKTMVAWVLGHK